jgi:4-oxalocrotonate tautomerase
MPIINVQVIEGVFTEQQKEDMQQKLTDAMVSVEGEALRPVTTVVVEEIPSGQWSIGGKLITTDAVKAMAAGGKSIRAA